MNNSPIIPKLSLVGAGPGDPELLTLKAIKTLEKADVVLYDALANESILEYCHADCEKIYVGKIGHQSSISQDSINLLIVEKAYQKGHVVRLKGGDPYILGRGGEEFQYATERGLQCDYIPGISSVMTPGLINIPLTNRGYSDGFWVITGHKSDKSLSEDLNLASQSNSTVVVLMGMSKLHEIKSCFENNGKSDLPFAIIQNATTLQQKYCKGTIKDILKIAEVNKMKNPSIIVLGEVVNSLNTEHNINDILENKLISLNSKIIDK
jgi:uroporphyrin-III C-methyltransferase